MKAFSFTVLASLVLTSVPAPAQDEELPPQDDDQTSAPTTAPIIVRGEQDTKEEVLVGSRIPQRAIFGDGIASSLGTRGLVPQSGMDQGASVRTIRRTECTSDNPAIGKQAACILIDAQSAMNSGDISSAQDLLAYLTLNPDFSGEERLAGAQWQYRLAERRNDDVSREIALEQMIDTGAMAVPDAISARKMLVSMALRDGRRVLARERLVAVDQTGGATARDLANLAILSREQKSGGADAVMRRAISAAENNGDPVPQGWLDFVMPPAG